VDQRLSGTQDDKVACGDLPLHVLDNGTSPPVLPTASDADKLRNQLAHRMEVHPPSEWSVPFMMALVGLFDAHILNLSLQAREARLASLRVVN
jgi:hypothetical protein